MAERVALAALALCAGCAPELVPATQVVVVVGGPPEIATLDLSVYTASGRNVVVTRTFTLAAGSALPSSFVIVPAEVRGGVEARFRVVVTGRAQGDAGLVPLARTAAVAGFTSRATTLLPLTLDLGCDDPFCGCEPDEETCARVCRPSPLEPFARCGDVPDYVRLADVEPGDELAALTSGAGGCRPGDVLAPDNTCTDLNECAFGLHDCDRVPFACENEVTGERGYTCRCPPGSTGDGVGVDGCLAKP